MREANKADGLPKILGVADWNVARKTSQLWEKMCTLPRLMPELLLDETNTTFNIIKRDLMLAYLLQT